MATATDEQMSDADGVIPIHVQIDGFVASLDGATDIPAILRKPNQEQTAILDQMKKSLNDEFFVKHTKYIVEDLSMTMQFHYPCYGCHEIVECFNQNHSFSNKLQHHILECPHCTIQCLIELLIDRKTIDCKQSLLRIHQCWFQRKLARKQIIDKRVSRRAFNKLFISTIGGCIRAITDSCPRSHTEICDNFRVELDTLLNIPYHLTSSQIEMIFKSKYLSKELHKLFNLPICATIWRVMY